MKLTSTYQLKGNWLRKICTFMLQRLEALLESATNWQCKKQLLISEALISVIILIRQNQLDFENNFKFYFFEVSISIIVIRENQLEKKFWVSVHRFEVLFAVWS